MFKLLRYFSITSLIAMVIGAALLGIFYRYIAIKELIEMGEDKNVALTKVFANSLRPEFSRFLASTSELSRDQLRSHPEITKLREVALAQMKGLSVAKIKLYNLQGLTVFSTEIKQIGEDQSRNAGFLSARSEKTVSSIVHRDKFNAFDQVIENRDLLQTYLPFRRGPDSPMEGVFELYDDVTTFLQKIKDTQMIVILGVVLISTLIYSVLFLIVRRADRILETQYTEIGSVNKALEAANKDVHDAQERLVRTERLAAIGELSAGVAHELRNPLGAIKNATYYIKGKLTGSDIVKENARIAEFLQIMDEEIESSNVIITDLMDFARVNPPNLSPTKLETVVENALSRTPMNKNVRVVKEIDPSLPEVLVDSEQMRRALANLIKNADEAMPDGGTLTILASSADGYGVLQLRDTGHGITDDHVPKIFDPLFTTKPRGIGLGLAIVKQIIDRHKGSVDVTSKPGEGTTFIIRIPLNPKRTGEARKA